ncbi:hypothetical protein HZS_1731 [Henneguya salminicola]|nr:hypothetical protein HZS_1731 [Henneguya salminicola]
MPIFIVAFLMLEIVRNYYMLFMMSNMLTYFYLLMKNCSIYPLKISCRDFFDKSFDLFECFLNYIMMNDWRFCESFSATEVEDFCDINDPEPDYYHEGPIPFYQDIMLCKCRENGIIYEIPQNPDGCSILNDPSSEYHNRSADSKFGRLRSWL